jgi:hypothetical protein
VLALTSPARAQTDGKFALGGEFGVRVPGARDVRGSDDLGLLWRFGHGENGWGFHWGLNWYATDIDRPIADRTVELGELRIRPLMAGYGYTRKIRAVSLTGAMLGGFAFTSFTLTPGAIDAYQGVGALSPRMHASAAPVLRPEVSAWYDVNRKVGFHIVAGYMIARPNLTVSSTAGDDRRRIKADMFSLKVGLAYSVF